MATHMLLLPLVVKWEGKVLNAFACVEASYRLPGIRGAERGQRLGKAKLGTRQGSVDLGDLGWSQPL